MSVSTSPTVTIGLGVQEFLRKNDAEAALQTICEILRECFPQTARHRTPGWRRTTTSRAGGVWSWTSCCRTPFPRTRGLTSNGGITSAAWTACPCLKTSLFVTAFEFPPE